MENGVGQGVTRKLKKVSRREASAVLDAVLPLLLPEIRSSHINRVAKFEHRF